MENTGRTVKKAIQRIKNNTKAPDFWAFVRALENANSGKPRLGKGKNPQDENVRFGQMPYLVFPPTDIAEIIEAGRIAGVDATIILYFFGLLGVNGPMPLEFTSYVFRRSHNHFDNTWRRFLDIINHRFTTFFYRSYAAGQQAMSFDRPDDDPFSFIIKNLAGFSATTNHQERLILKSALRFSFLAKTRQGLEDMLRRLFNFPIDVRDYIPLSRDIPHDSRVILGRKNNTLGLDMQIGRTYTSITGKFEIRIGPISYEDYHIFISSRSGGQFLVEAVSLYMDRPLNYSMLFIIRRDTIPPARLGFDLAEGRWDASRLGYTCWIGSVKEKFTTLSIGAARFNRGRKVNKEAFNG